jgi:hypothetical protein
MNQSTSVDRLEWAIAARARSQRLLLALWEWKADGRGKPEIDLFSTLVGVAFSLWRAAFLTSMPTRTREEAHDDAHGLLESLLSTNSILFGQEHKLQGWTGGYYLNNAKLRLIEIYGRAGIGSRDDAKRVDDIKLIDTDPLQTWTQFCDEAEALAGTLGCNVRTS